MPTFEHHLQRAMAQSTDNVAFAYDFTDEMTWHGLYRPNPVQEAPAAQIAANQPMVPMPCDNLDGTDFTPIVAAAPGGRKWSPQQVRAIETMSRLGARLDDTASTLQVRCAFRSLAHRLHPDTGGASASETGFAALMDAWDLLRHGPEGGYDDTVFRPIYAQGPM